MHLGLIERTFEAQTDGRTASSMVERLLQDVKPFESGGQVGDVGRIDKDGSTIVVEDCRKAGDHHVHIGKVVAGEFSCGDQVSARIDVDLRRATTLNHSATHLLHEALRQVLGEHV